MLKQQQELADTETGSGRRGFLGWMGRAGIVTVGGLAGLAATQGKATADDGTAPCTWVSCCCLARPNKRCSGGAGFKCPNHYNRKTWYCCHGTGGYSMCGECLHETAGSTCHSGKETSDYYCSVRVAFAGPCQG